MYLSSSQAYPFLFHLYQHHRLSSPSPPSASFTVVDHSSVSLSNRFLFSQIDFTQTHHLLVVLKFSDPILNSSWSYFTVINSHCILRISQLSISLSKSSIPLLNQIVTNTSKLSISLSIAGDEGGMRRRRRRRGTVVQINIAEERTCLREREEERHASLLLNNTRSIFFFLNLKYQPLDVFLPHVLHPRP